MHLMRDVVPFKTRDAQQANGGVDLCGSDPRYRARHSDEGRLTGSKHQERTPVLSENLNLSWLFLIPIVFGRPAEQVRRAAGLRLLQNFRTVADLTCRRRAAPPPSQRRDDRAEFFSATPIEAFR